jgi:D-sedoheptulose 7-phosphate isomerase
MFDELVRTRLQESIRAKERLAETGTASIVSAAELIARSFERGGKLLICGNGGSAGDAQHIAAELVVRLTPKFERGALPALALTTDTSLITACANDYGYDVLFSRQVEALGRVGDVLLGITTSGKSPNVVKAFEAAKKLGIHTILLSAGDGARCAPLADVAILVPTPEFVHPGTIQESHIAVGHIICEIVERIHCGRES